MIRPFDPAAVTGLSAVAADGWGVVGGTAGDGSVRSGLIMRERPSKVEPSLISMDRAVISPIILPVAWISR